MSGTTSPRVHGVLVAGLYLLAALLIVQPLAEWLAAVWPPRIGQASWRYGALGILSGTLLTPMLGLVLAGGVGMVREHSWPVRVLSLLALIIGPLMVLSCVSFALDAVELKTRVPDQGQTRYLMESLRTLFRVSTAGTVLTVLGLGGLLAVRRAARDAAAAAPQHASLLAVRGP